ncbi:MAG: orotidine 5'-phosphate decarboxylase / HUMPS family protein [Oscillospiraceae bacterium]
MALRRGLSDRDARRALCRRGSGDQKRVTTPERAREIGSDYIVVGRPITQADDPVAAFIAGAWPRSSAERRIRDFFNRRNCYGYQTRSCAQPALDRGGVPAPAGAVHVGQRHQEPHLLRQPPHPDRARGA